MKSDGLAREKNTQVDIIICSAWNYFKSRSGIIADLQILANLRESAIRETLWRIIGLNVVVGWLNVVAGWLNVVGVGVSAPGRIEF